MQILLGECLPKKLKKELAGHEVKTVVEKGWSGAENGDLLDWAEVEFDVFLTVDQNLSHQQNVAQRNIAVLVLKAQRNRIEYLRLLMPHALQALQTIQPGNVVLISS